MALSASARKPVVLAKYIDWKFTEGEERFRGVTGEHAVNLANKRGVVLASNKELDRRLVLTREWEDEQYIYPAWSGTLVVTAPFGVSFGDAVNKANELSRKEDSGITYAFKVPEKYLGAVNAALVVEHGFDARGEPVFEFRNEGRNGRLVHVHDERRIHLVKNVPHERGWYVPDPWFGLPVGKLVEPWPDRPRHVGELAPWGRGLRRVFGFGNWFSLIVRGWGQLDYGYEENVDPLITGGDMSSDRYGALGFSPVSRKPLRRHKRNP
ncbi:hypothetical protein HY572_03420 [Candidatus Micrarchaeota archaeon]|nr:hypothetical protein [Candidatus Micrarchaeota archaeon]